MRIASEMRAGPICVCAKSIYQVTKQSQMSALALLAMIERDCLALPCSPEVERRFNWNTRYWQRLIVVIVVFMEREGVPA
jgi:hypothetical protein